MPARRNYEVALKDYVDRYIALEDSERAKDYDALMQAIDNIGNGASVNVDASGSGLVFDSAQSALVHKNKLDKDMTQMGQDGAGSGMFIPTIEWDENGHITNVRQNPVDGVVKQNSLNAVLSGAVYQAIEEEKTRAMDAEARAVQVALAAGTEYAFVTTLKPASWDDRKRQKVHNEHITGLDTEILDIDVLTYDGYYHNVRGVDAKKGELIFQCDTVPANDVEVRVIISSAVKA